MSDELEQLLKGIAMMKELTLRTRDYLVSFGECMSTRIFAALLNKLGVKARQVYSLQLNFFYPLYLVDLNIPSCLTSLNIASAYCYFQYYFSSYSLAVSQQKSFMYRKQYKCTSVLNLY